MGGPRPGATPSQGAEPGPSEKGRRPQAARPRRRRGGHRRPSPGPQASSPGKRAPRGGGRCSRTSSSTPPRQGPTARGRPPEGRLNDPDQRTVPAKPGGGRRRRRHPPTTRARAIIPRVGWHAPGTPAARVPHSVAAAGPSCPTQGSEEALGGRAPGRAGPGQSPGAAARPAAAALQQAEVVSRVGTGPCLAQAPSEGQVTAPAAEPSQKQASAPAGQRPLLTVHRKDAQGTPPEAAPQLRRSAALALPVWRRWKRPRGRRPRPAPR